MSRLPILTVLLAALLAGCGQAAREVETVERVADGDTVVLAGGERVRLVQIDAPELAQECYGRRAAGVLRELLLAGAQVELEADPALDGVDRFGRLLRYVHLGGVNLNLELVRRGAATVYFFRSARGRYADALLRAGQTARDEGRGLWGACTARWDPERPAATGR